MSTVKKRLHISGLTPAITSNDLITRLHGFGKVLSLDGLGILNAVGECLSRGPWLLVDSALSLGVGEPRKYAYVTLEATEPNLARCLLLVLCGPCVKFNPIDMYRS